MLQEKARKFSLDFGVENFGASNGWLIKFRVRHNIVFQQCAEKVLT